MIEVKFEKEKKRAALYDGDKEIGVCTYEERDRKWAITHTIVSPDYQGRGLAQKVLECVLNAAECEGIEIIPVCSYAVRYFEKNGN